MLFIIQFCIHNHGQSFPGSSAYVIKFYNVTFRTCSIPAPYVLIYMKVLGMVSTKQRALIVSTPNSWISRPENITFEHLHIHQLLASGG